MKEIKYPKRIKVSGRTSSITNAFYNGILPVIKHSEKEESDLKELLNYNESKGWQCIYCGNVANTFDHLNSLINDKKPTGYFSEPGNLVPSCNSCNSSKGKKHWKEFMDTALMSYKNNTPRRLKIHHSQYAKGVKQLISFEKKFKAKKINFDNQTQVKTKMAEHRKKLDIILKSMDESKKTENELIHLIEQNLHVLTH